MEFGLQCPFPGRYIKGVVGRLQMRGVLRCDSHNESHKKT
jgi:hypothetical protein